MMTHILKISFMLLLLALTACSGNQAEPEPEVQIQTGCSDISVSSEITLNIPLDIFPSKLVIEARTDNTNGASELVYDECNSGVEISNLFAGDFIVDRQQGIISYYEIGFGFIPQLSSYKNLELVVYSQHEDCKNGDGLANIKVIPVSTGEKDFCSFSSTFEANIEGFE